MKDGEKKKGAFQLRLSTCLAVMLASGVIAWLNIRPRILQENSEKSNLCDYTVKFGFPFDCYFGESTYIWLDNENHNNDFFPGWSKQTIRDVKQFESKLKEGKRVDGWYSPLFSKVTETRDINNIPDSLVLKWNYYRLAGNLAVSLFILIFIIVLFEKIARCTRPVSFHP